MKKLNLILTLSIITITLFSCGNSSTNSSNATNNTNTTNTRTFTVGFDAEYPPYGYMAENGEYTGFDLELADEVCKRTNMTLVKQPIDWDSKDLELNSGKIDCIWNGFTMTGRENDYTFSDPYVDNSIVVVVLKDSNINSLKDLSGKSVLTQAGSSGLNALMSDENKDLLNSFKVLEQCSDYNNGFMALESGVNDALVVDIGVAKYQLENRKDMFRMLNEEVTKEQYAIGFKKGNTELCDLVNNTLKEIYNDGTFMTIANKYSDYNLPDMVIFGK